MAIVTALQKQISQTPTITAGAYAAGDALGGLLTFEGATRQENLTALLLGVTILDLAKQDAQFDLVLFNQTFTPTTDNAAFDPTDADLAHVIGHVQIAAADYADFNDSSIATVTGVNLPIHVTGSVNLYGQLVNRSTPTYATTSDLTVILYLMQD
ncbi:MAG: hypothetical protein NUW01_14185 [Gemmatimonadaceae bacterium]|nr:hypothetical protein [Gemmatimonadaceae bacterium]